MSTPPRLTAGKVRGLTQASTAEGVFTILAIDHRDAMRVVVSPSDPASVPASTLTRIKLDLLADLGAEATAVMLDSEFSIGQAVATRILPGTVGFLAAVEAQGYLGDPTERRTTLLDGWSVEKAKRVGAAGIKLLVLYRPDSGAVAEVQDRMISAVIADCARADIPLFLEPVAYVIEDGLDADSPEFAAKRRDLVIDSVRRLGALGPDVLKVQFPVDTCFEPDQHVWADACAELDEVAPVPWALLSGGDPYELSGTRSGWHRRPAPQGSWSVVRSGGAPSRRRHPTGTESSRRRCGRASWNWYRSPASTAGTGLLGTVSRTPTSAAEPGVLRRATPSQRSRGEPGLG